MPRETQPHTVQPDRPARPSAESRQETIERVLHEADDAQNARLGEARAAPTSRRGVNRAVARRALGFAAVGAAAGADRGVVLTVAGGPFETGGAAGAAGIAVAMAIALGIVVGLIATLILLAREDGRVEREVERATGRGPEGPGSPGDPRYDIRDG
jgi:hypothetical protein